MTIEVSDLNSYVQSNAGAALRTFYKRFTVSIEAYNRQYGFDNTYGAWMQFNNTRSTRNYTRTFYAGDYNNSEFNGYYDSEIVAGRLIYAQDIVDTIGIAMQRAVDLAEARVGNHLIYVRYCHASCHGSCHTSRGRR